MCTTVSNWDTKINFQNCGWTKFAGIWVVLCTKRDYEIFSYVIQDSIHFLGKFRMQWFDLGAHLQWFGQIVEIPRWSWKLFAMIWANLGNSKMILETVCNDLGKLWKFQDDLGAWLQWFGQTLEISRWSWSLVVTNWQNLEMICWVFYVNQLLTQKIRFLSWNYSCFLDESLSKHARECECLCFQSTSTQIVLHAKSMLMSAVDHR